MTNIRWIVAILVWIFVFLLGWLFIVVQWTAVIPEPSVRDHLIIWLLILSVGSAICSAGELAFASFSDGSPGPQNQLYLLRRAWEAPYGPSTTDNYLVIFWKMVVRSTKESGEDMNGAIVIANNVVNVFLAVLVAGAAFEWSAEAAVKEVAAVRSDVWQAWQSLGIGAMLEVDGFARLLIFEYYQPGAFWFEIIGLTLVLLIFGETIPKRIALKMPALVVFILFVIPFYPVLRWSLVDKI